MGYQAAQSFANQHDKLQRIQTTGHFEKFDLHQATVTQANISGHKSESNRTKLNAWLAVPVCTT